MIDTLTDPATGQSRLATSQISPGDSLPFVFVPPAGPMPPATAWACEIRVVPSRGEVSAITPRTITPDSDKAFRGFLTAAETAALADKDYFLVAVFTAQDQRAEEAVRFRVRAGWAA